jgi:dipeptidase D
MPPVTDRLAGLEPAAFWRHFEALTRIPRASHEEDRAVAHVEAWASGRGFSAARDGAGNLVVRVPAVAGRESEPVVILQGHLDMVCEREPDSPNDPRAGRIELVRDGEWLRAKGTTLGADDGVAIAAMMAIAEDPGVEHGPLELLMTVAEEVGLAGAAALDPDLISGSVLLNLDSEEDGTFTVGCAGGADTLVRVRASRAPVDGPWASVTVSGALGGHSGGDIALGRANAIKVLARALRAAPGVRIAALEGGASRNAIPRDATALVAADADARAAIEREAARIQQAYLTTDPGLRIAIHAAAGSGAAVADDDSSLDAAVQAAATDAWSEHDSARILDLIAILPSGPLAMSVGFPGVVETSSSLGVVATEGGTLTLRSLSRSADDAALPDVLAAISGAARLAGAEYELGANYPGWRPDLDSPVLLTAKAVHERLFGAAPHVTLTHGGLEAAIIAAKRPGIDPISFGPEIQGPHAPGERLHLGSAERFMRLLAALLDELTR